MHTLTPPPCHLTEFRLCMVLLEASENARFHVTFLALQMPFNFNHCHCMMLDDCTIFEFTVNSQKTECTFYLSYDASI